MARPDEEGSTRGLQNTGQPSTLEASPERKPSYIVGIGASAGGLEALERLFDKMPTDTGMAFVVVQHLSPDFKSLMEELLRRWTKMPIYAAEDAMPIAANAIYLMPPKKEMIISDGKLVLTDKGPADELTLPIDQFFRSLARDAGPRAIAVVLSGTGSDGSRGIRDIHQVGGLVVVQSEVTAKFDGMPRSAMETGVVDSELALEEIPATLLKHINDPRADIVTEKAEAEANGMTPIFRLLHDAYGIDLSYYKPSTVCRRIERRLQLMHAADLAAYVERLRADRQELDALYRDLLIGVTGFFRDEAAFRALEEHVLPDLLKHLPSGDEFRVWVAGCATGEEAYSLAILVHEQMRQLGRPCNAKIFATDVHRASLETAATGLYNESALAGVSRDRLEKYFNHNGERYQVSSELRQMVVFAPHNITKDAPFTRLDLITCRNLLIYLQPAAQKKALCLFHFGLKTGGVLFLGPSESPGEIADEFDTVDQHWKIFRKRRNIRLPADMRLPLFAGYETRMRDDGTLASRKADRQLNELFGSLLEQSLPPGVLVNERREIVHTFGDANQYLRLRKGKPSLDLLDLLRDDLRLAAAGAIHRAMREGKKVVFSGVHAPTSSGERYINLSATPIPTSRGALSYTLVSFENANLEAPADTVHADLTLAEVSRDRVETLEAELRYTKENLQATIEELETSNEELQATNEEMLASNEELQSTNEELHSVNEELYTVNAEYQKKIGELTELTHDMDNLLVSTDVHTIFLDEELCIRKFTPRMAEVFNLIPADIGRRIDGFVHTILCNDLQQKLANVLSKGERYEEEVCNNTGDEFLMRILPYRGDSERSGVVMTLIDITSLKQAEALFRNAVEAAPSGMLMIDRSGQITLINSEMERMFGYSRDELLGQQVEILLAERFREQHVAHRQEFFHHPRLRPMADGLDLWGLRKEGSEFPVDVRLSPVDTPRGLSVLAAVIDVTDRKRLESSLRDQVIQRDRFLATLSHELRNPMTAILAAASMLTRIAADSPETTEPCGVIRRQASHIATLLDDLLDVSRVTQRKIKLRREVMELTLVGKEAIEAVAPLLAAHQHDFHLDIVDKPLWVDVDHTRMLQVLENLLTNAIKYTPDGGNIWLTLDREGPQAVIRVRDDGRGISPELLDSIFDIFVQSDDTLHRSEGGMGVGLTLVRSLVELHEGTIEGHSDGLNQGSEFVARLPLTTKRPPRGSGPIVPHDPKQLRLGLVEDSDDARHMFEALLTFEGYQVHTASNGREGFEMIMREQPDVVLLDIGLPDLDGYQVARQVRDQFTKDEIYLIAVTGYGRKEDHEVILEAGFDEHLVKPLNLKEIKTALSKAVKSTGIGITE
jgi:two-component system CheB/CheR fusion protein